MFTSDDLLDVLKALRGGVKSKGASPLDQAPPRLPRLYGDGNWIDFDDIEALPFVGTDAEWAPLL